MAVKPRARCLSITPPRLPRLRVKLHAEGKKRGFDFIDAPVSGGQAGAENGVLTVMCGGDAEPYARAEPVIAAYARMPASSDGNAPVPDSSPRWSIRSALPASCRDFPKASTFAKKAGLDIEALIATISKGAAQSWQMENRYKTMMAGKYDFGFAVDWMRKDLSICIGEARKNGAICRLPPWSISSTPKSKRWAAAAGTRPACLPASTADA